MATLRSNLTVIAAKCPAKASEALLQTGHDIFVISDQLVPKDTTSLQHSGGVEVVDSNTVQVGYGIPGVFFDGREPAKYAVPVEYGGGNSPAQPYLTPAFAQSVPTFAARLGQKMQELVQEESLPGGGL